MSIHNTEMQIQIDDVYACPGHCPGCALSSLERKGYEPDVSLDTLHLIYNKIIGNNLDLAINLSVEAMQSISPKDLYEFALKNNFKEVTINWTPTFDNLSFSYQNQKEMSIWLIEFDELLLKDNRIGTSYRPTIIKNMLRLQSQQNDSLLEVIQNNLKETILKTIQINHLGNIYPRFEAIGDIGQTQRFNFEPLGNIKDDSIFNIINNNFHQTKKYILNSLMKTPCNDCEYNKYCATSGFHIYNKVLHTNQKDINTAQRINANIKENNCLHIAKRLFQHYEKQLFNFNND